MDDADQASRDASVLPCQTPRLTQAVRPSLRDSLLTSRQRQPLMRGPLFLRDEERGEYAIWDGDSMIYA